MNWKRHLAVGSMALLFAVGFSAFAQDKDKSSAKPSDPQIVGVVTAADQIDIDTAKVALKKTKNDQVKQFAQQMIDDHTKLQNSVNDLGKKLNVKPAPSDISKSLKTAAAAETKKLQGLSGKAFDTEYINHEVAYHQQVLDAAGNVLIPNAQNAELKSALQGAAPLLQGHLDHAKQLQSSLGGSTGGSHLKLMTPFLAAWRVRLGIAVLVLLSGSSVSVAHPRIGVTGVLALVQTSGMTSQNLSSAGPSANGQVVMKGIRFQPAELTVHPGEIVEFKNEDIVAHTVTADDGSFDSGLIQPGSSWKMAVQKAGTLAYHCTPHPNMKAVLVASSGAQMKETHGAAGGLPGFRPPRSPQELHPILVNFTAALLPLALLSDLLGRWLKRSSLNNAAAWMVLYAAIITPITGAAGWWWKINSAGTLPPELIAVHQWLGTSLALVFIVLAVWRWRIHRQNAVPTLAYLAFAVVAVLALVYQGNLGGAMVFGR